MDAKAKTVRDILYSGDQFLIPFFQRHYSWKLKHWLTLWEDLTSLVDDAHPRMHFMGPLVCTPVNHMPGDLPVYQLIDGQQRLTTITILLAVLRDLAHEHDLQELAEDITERYLIQKREKGLNRYKVVPRVGDREVLFAVIDGKAADHSRRDGIIRAQRFFKAAVQQYIKNDMEKALRQLATAVTAWLSLVVISIEGENPYEIFESLNSTGLPLEESDLIRNFVFMKVPLSEQEDFHRLHWQPLEAMFEGTDDEDRMDMTVFYRDYLMRNGEYSRKKATFVDFKDHLKGRDITPVALIQELRKFARFELALRLPSTSEDSRLKSALECINALEVTTAYPLLTHLLARHSDGGLSKDELLQCIADLESFVIRRSICGESTRSYNELFPAAIRSIAGSPCEDLRRFWTARGWPNDEAFTASLLNFALYRREPKKCQLILEQLEASFGHKEGPKLKALTIEHVMPQSIIKGQAGQSWQGMLGNKWSTLHEEWLHTLGNLTLTGYNPKLSNDSFERKKAVYKKSNVQLNAHFHKISTWDATAIRARGKRLASQVAERWPSFGAYVRQPAVHEVTANLEGRGEARKLRADYWQAFRKVLGEIAPTLEPKKQPEDRPSLSFLGTSGWFAAALDTDEACVSVELCFRDQFAGSQLDVLRQDELAIEAELGEQVEWEAEENTKKAALYLDSAQPGDRADWPRQHRWLAQKLKQLIDVLGPRIHTPQPPNAGKLLLAFWTGLDQHLLAAGNHWAMLKAQGEQWRDVDLEPGVGIWLRFDPEEHWVGTGLIFKPDGDERQWEAASADAEQLRTLVQTPVWPEIEGKTRYLAMYHRAKLDDNSNWPELYRWVANKMDTCRVFQKRLAGSPLAQQAL